MHEADSARAAAIAGEPLPSGEVLDALDRLVNNAAFRASVRRKAFLRFLVEETLAGRADRLKGFQIATAVFGRDETFDSQTDPVVRLEARRLRRDLEHYYLAAGHGDAVRISIAKGAYVPSFERQDAKAPSASPAPTMEANVVSSVSPDALPDTTSGTPPTATAETAKKGGEAAGRGFLRLVILALLGIAILIAAAGVWLWNERLHDSSETTPIEPQERGPSVIVLPFEPLSTREDDQFLATGMTQQLITELMRFAAFKLYSVPASLRQNAAADPVDVGRSLAVAYVVKGSVRSDAGRVRVGAQLVDAKTGQVLWSETYDRDLTPDNLLGVQEDLAGQVATRLAQPYGVIHEAVTTRFNRESP